MKDSPDRTAPNGFAEPAARKAWNQPAMSRLPLKNASFNHAGTHTDGAVNKS